VVGGIDKVAELTAACRREDSSPAGLPQRGILGMAPLRPVLLRWLKRSLRLLPPLPMLSLGPLLLFSACGGGGAAEPPAEPPTQPRWTVLGSSTAAGVGASAGQSWTARLAEALRLRGVQLDNRARSGATTYQALPAAEPRAPTRPATDPAQDAATALATRPAALLLAFPSNDALLGYSAAETTANLLRLRELARQQGVAVIVLSSQPRDDAGAPAREALRATDAALAAELGPCFVDVREALSDGSGRIAPAYAAGDGVHLNNAGHGLVFERLWAVVEAGRCLRLPASVP
jgi:acyl-CoA thioesterase I